MKKGLSILLAVCLLFALTACGAKTAPVENNAENSTKETSEVTTNETLPTLNIGVMSSVDMLPIFMADKNGYFEKNGVDVNVQVFKSFKDRDAALQAGELDGIIGDLVAISIYQNAGMDMVVTGSTDGVFMLVAGKDSKVNAIEDFNGEKVAISENTVIEYTIDQLMKEADKPLTAIQKEVIPPLPTRLEMLNAGEVDASLMPNPFSDAALAAGAREIKRISSETDEYISVTAFLNTVIEAKPDALKAFYKGYNEGVAYLNENEVASYEADVIEAVGYPETMKGKITVPVFKINALPEKALVEKVFAWSKEKGLLTTVLDLDHILNPIGTALN